MTTFNVGDRVRCIDGANYRQVETGQETTVTNVARGRLSLADSSAILCYDPDNFELVTEDAAPFKPGDKIRALASRVDLTVGRIYEVLEYQPDAGGGGRIRFVDDSGEPYTRAARRFEKVTNEDADPSAASEYVPTREHQKDIQTIFEALEATKDRSEWCGEYNRRLREVNEKLTVKLGPAEPEWQIGDVVRFHNGGVVETFVFDGTSWFDTGKQIRNIDLRAGGGLIEGIKPIIKGGKLLVESS